ncbi:MAG: NAD-dependent epimerase/dehydratase family protein [Halioglobus sp.]
MPTTRKVLIFGAAGRVGLGLASALLQKNVNVTVADAVEQDRLSAIFSRILIDARLSGSDAGEISVHGNFNVLEEQAVVDLLQREQPDVVVNYAIPFTWDAAKRLPNYSKISEAGLGAFAAIQVLAPKIIGQALANSGVDTKYVVGNLPDITIPIIYGLGRDNPMALPIAGAGNVGLIQSSIKQQIAVEQGLSISEISVALVAHHVHWVAPREPGYSNEAPFLLKAIHLNEDITASLGDTRELMNRSIVSCYEPGAGFSSTTALLAAKLVLSLLDDSGAEHRLHVPAPNGLPGGYPITVKNGSLSLNLPSQWSHSDAEHLMKQAHQKDGIETIGADGTIHFNPKSVAILKREIDFTLPQILAPGDLEDVAKEQIRVAQAAIARSQS